MTQTVPARFPSDKGMTVVVDRHTFQGQYLISGGAAYRSVGNNLPDNMRPIDPRNIPLEGDGYTSIL